jgi:5-methylcytosine-specific restriction endonuclease McrA
MEAPATPVKRGYHRNSKKIIRSKRWKSLRFQALRRDGFKCRTCGASGRLEIDHVQPVRTHPELAFELANLQALCAACHSRKTRIECGFKPPSQERLAWCEAVKQLSKKEVKPCSQA